MITIHNLRKEKPEHPYDVRIDRGHSSLANPFKMDGKFSRDSVCDKFYTNFIKVLKHEPEMLAEIVRLIALYKEHGKLRLFCWCVPARCHGETIRDYLLKVIRLRK